MAYNKLSELKKVARLESLYDSKMDMRGDIKQIIAYEIINFKIIQNNRIISKKYYKEIYKKNYTFTSIYDEIEQYRKLYKTLSNITPFNIDIQFKNRYEIDDISPLIDYYNTNSIKYYNFIINNGIYNKKKDELMRIRKNININTIDDYIDKLDFEILNEHIKNIKESEE